MITNSLEVDFCHFQVNCSGFYDIKLERKIIDNNKLSAEAVKPDVLAEKLKKAFVAYLLNSNFYKAKRPVKTQTPVRKK